MKNKAAGFTLVEIMVVVAIVGILASVAVPNLLRSRVNANEGAIKGNFKTFSGANESYRAVQQPVAYAPNIATLVSETPSYLDSTWNTNPKHGFTLTYTAATAPASNYSLLGVPSAGFGGTTNYCIDHTGILVSGSTGSVTGPATGCAGGTPLTS